MRAQGGTTDMTDGRSRSAGTGITGKVEGGSRSACTGIKGGLCSQEARKAGELPTARAIHRLSWSMGDKLPKTPAKGEGVRVATGAPHRRVARGGVVKRK